MTTPMIDRLKERIAELEQDNTVLQSLLACAVAHSCTDGMECLFIEADAVRAMDGRTLTSEPTTDASGRDGVMITIDPAFIPYVSVGSGDMLDFSGDMQGLLAREDRH